MELAEREACMAAARAYCTDKEYLFDRVIGTGAFKIVLLVRRQDFTPVALKVTRAQTAKESKRIETEISIYRRCRSRHLARLFAVEHTDPFTFFEEEYCAGGTLRDRLKETQTLERAELRAVILGLVEGLESMWSERLIHRDVKPENALFRSVPAREIALTDFGVARNLSLPSITTTGIGIGTCGYAPREQVFADHDLLDWRTDQFALGVLLLECAIGRRPFAASSFLEWAEVVQRGDPPLADVVQRATELGLDRALTMLAHTPDRRYLSPRELVSALKEIL